MKKFVLIAAVLLLATGFVFADPLVAVTPSADTLPSKPLNTSAGVVVSAALQGYLTVSLNSSASILLSTLGGSNVPVATGKVATNLKSWRMKVTSANSGALKSKISDALSYSIPYTLTLVGDTTIGEAFKNASISSELTKDYSTRVTGGADGEVVNLTISYAGENTDQWYAGLVYTDTITVTLSAL